LLAKANPGNIH